jgi:hypothetical protein
MSSTINQGRLRLTGLKCKGRTGALTSMQSVAVNERGLLWLSRTSGPEPGHKHDFTVKFLCFKARAPDEVKEFLLCIPT